MASFIRSICERYLTFTPAEWDAQGDACAAFLSASCPPGAALYVWTSQVAEVREVKSRRSREIEETDDEEEEEEEGGGAPAPAAAAPAAAAAAAAPAAVGEPSSPHTMRGWRRQKG
jgi:hypothetical protein